MKNLIKQFLPQWAINWFYHLPTAFLANVIYGFPSRGIKVIGVTGTDGKTTTVNMIYQILKASGKKVSMVSTINAVVGGKETDTGFHVTSPNPFLLQKLIKESVNKGCDYIVLEVTSHALDQFRFFGTHFDVCVITNITHEHLDYHGTWTNYFNSKAKLIKNVEFAVLNKDEKYFSKLAHLVNEQCKVASFGFSKSAEFNPEKSPLKLKIPGEFNVLNGLAASATCSVLGVDNKTIKSVLANFQFLPGRMEEVRNERGLKIILDFAHTPNGLENALTALRSKESLASRSEPGRLISLIGAEGFRDIKKRSMMGEIAQKLSDIVIVTAVDPRGQIREINKQIKKGALKSGAKSGVNFYIIPDRQKAVNFAVRQLSRKGDIIGIFGKGHEKSMNLDGKAEIYWSDKEAVEKALWKTS
ncbi:hypothetical protein A2769_04410 [Candidatus Daviesbacteria bacterium RIFCSPHIGHO2_01_FULL_37_27]|nr:MAG: hypothetical protein A2769_04410 [Candidatus Daviesbacteria bacterium RIFCSPHIGHO2_01_FULL_37_27]